MALVLFILAIDPRYHTFEEVTYELDSIANHYPHITLLDTLGYSTRDSLPIFAMKISDNVNVDEDEPAVLYIACHHAEEILGIEVCMYMIDDLINNYNIDSTITYWIDNREIWIVPLLNPEGHNVVMNEIDTTWRKNKRDNNNNGNFDLDYDGVDPNRNYDFHWAEGGSSDPPSEYYRGTAPFSENETRAIRDLCMSQTFIFCNTYHSARTGLGEVIYYPWVWSGGYSPDFPFIREVADSMSKLIINDEGTGHYTALPGYGLDGKARNWLYGVCGTFAFCVEVSTTCIQPGWMVNDICARNIVGAYYLLDRVCGSGITGCIYDYLTREPISAEVIINGYYDPNLPPRQSDPDFGCFLRIVTPGIYNIEVHKHGYESQYFYDIEVKQGQMIGLDIELRKIEWTEKLGNTYDLQLYPNPAQEFLIIGKANQFYSIKICDVTGRVLRIFDRPTTNHICWMCNDELNRQVSNGIYFVIGEYIEPYSAISMPGIERVVRKAIISH